MSDMMRVEAEVPGISHRLSASDQLRVKKKRLEAELTKVNAALDAFEKNPDMALAIDAVFEAL